MNNNIKTAQTHRAFARGRPSLIWAAALLVAPLGFAQQSDDEQEEEIFELSPFTVGGSDTTGYRANSTLAGTRIRAELKDLGSAISAYTEDFMKDIGATDNSTLLQYTTNAEVGGTQSTYAGGQNGATLNESAALVSPQTNNRIRGLSNADNTRDFVVTDIPWDSYNTDRIDVLRGANSFLFGLGSPAGIVNASISGAAFQDSGKVDLRFGSYGSARAAVTLNKVIVEDTLAVRFSGLVDEEKYRQDQAFENDERGYLALRYEPKLFASDSMSSALNFKYENGSINANRPRNITPMDGVSSWYRDRERDTASNPFGGLGRTLIENPFEAAAGIQNQSSDEYSPWVGTAANQQQPFWLLDGATGQVYDARAGIINNGSRNADGSVRSSSEGVVGRRNTSPFLASAQLSDAAIALRLPFANTGLYKAESLKDPSIFDFYNQLIDGDTKSETADWDALNLDFTQTFFNNRLGVQLVYDKQKYERANEDMLGWQPTIKMDIMQNWDDFTPNQNVGRPYVTSGGGSGGLWSSDREYARASLYGQLSASDFMDSDGFLAKLLGTHRFNSVASKENYGEQSYAYYNVIADADWYSYWTTSNGQTYPFTDRMPVGIIYLGDSIADQSQAAGANIPAVSASNIRFSGNSVRVFDTTWVAGPEVAFDAPWTNIPPAIAGAYNLPDADEDPLLQNSNPDNYLGWTERPIGLLYREDGNPNLSRLDYKNSEVKSTAVNLQSYWWENALVTTIGWRRDEVESGSTTYTKDPANRYFVTVPIEREPRTLEGESISGGAVLHINKLFGGNDPIPFNVSLSYNKGSNFQPTSARNDIYGNEINNPSGKTKDYGISLSTKDGKYTLRAIKYESLLKDASTSLNANNIGATVANGLTWRNVFLYKLGAYGWGDREQLSYRNRASNAFPIPEEGVTSTLPYQVAPDSPEELALEDAMINGWNDIQAWLTDKGFLDAWSMNTIPLQYLTDRSTYAATLNGKDPASQYVPPANTVTNISYALPQNFAVTADVLSKGYEFEFLANPTENWRFALNASKTESINYNVGGELLTEFVNYMNEALVGTPAGALPRWGGYGGAIGPSIWANFQANYTLMKLQEGSVVPELRKWRYSAVTNYTFSDGKLKGLGLGASYRWQDKMAISYPLEGVDATTYTFDLANPIYAPAEDAIDLWASYGRKLTDKIDWRVQLNVRNVGKGDELIPVTVQPDPAHTIAGVRIGPTQEWFLTNTFSF